MLESLNVMPPGDTHLIGSTSLIKEEPKPAYVPAAHEAKEASSWRLKDRVHNRRKRHQPDLPLIFHCSACGAAYADRYAFDRHQRNGMCRRRQVSKIVDLKNDASSLTLQGAQRTEPVQTFYCAVCALPFSDPKSGSIKLLLKNHHVTHAANGRSKPPTSAKTDGFKVVWQRKLVSSKVSVLQKRYDGTRFYCAACCRSYSRKQPLERHICAGKCLARKVYVCTWPGCNAERKIVGLMLLHHNVHLRKYECQECSKTFETDHKLKGHLRSKHFGFRCDCCSYICESLVRLKRHEARGTCAKLWNRLRLAKSADSPSGGVKLDSIISSVTFACDWPGCSVVKATAAMLRKHKNIHLRRFVCELCGKCSQDAYDHKRHAELHRNGAALKAPKRQSFPCDFCAAVFDRAAALKVHKKTHKLERTAKPPREKPPPKVRKAKLESSVQDGSVVVGFFQPELPLPTSNSDVTSSSEEPCLASRESTAVPSPQAIQPGKISDALEEPSSLFACDWPNCSVIRFSEHSLKRHKNVHLGKFKCRVCAKCFESSNDLSKHSPSCLADKAMAFSLCQSAPIASVGLIQPIANEQNQPITNEHMQPMEIRGEEFETLRPLNPLPWVACTICGNFCNGQIELKEHNLQLHAPPAHVFKCKICALSFPRFHDLMVHHKSHK